MSQRSLESQALHDGFARHLLPVLAPLGFVEGPVPKESRAVGWTTLAAECRLDAARVLRAELECYGTTAPRFRLLGPSGEIPLLCSQADPDAPRRATIAHAMTSFEALGDARQGGEQLAARRRLALEFLAAELAATSEQLVAALPELAPRVAAARSTAAWRDAAARARALWNGRNVRSAVEDRPVEGRFAFFGAALVIVEAEGQRFTFRFDTASIDRSRAPIVSGWWTTPAGTRRPSLLVVGDARLRFDSAGNLVAS